MTEPHCGSDVQAIRTRAVRDGDEWVVTGEKRWQANGLRAGVMALLVKTDPDADPPHRGMTCLLLEKTPGAMREGGLQILGLLPKLGYLGIDSTAMRLDGHRLPASAVLGGEAGVGRGFQQMMSGVEVGRVNVAARAIGTARRAYELAMTYAHEREAFGQQIVDLQAIQFKLADMATPSRQPGCWPCRQRAPRTRGSGQTSRQAWRSCSPRRCATRWYSMRCASTAATATPRSTRSSASTATRRCCCSARARARSRDDRRARTCPPLGGRTRWDVTSTRARRLRPLLRGVRARRHLPPLAGQDDHRGRRSPLLHDHDEPPPPAHRRSLRRDGDAVRAERGGREPRLLTGARDERAGSPARRSRTSRSSPCATRAPRSTATPSTRGRPCSTSASPRASPTAAS